MLLLSLLPGRAWAGETTTQPFVGVTYIARTETAPRPNRMHVVIIDLKAPGIRFLVTPQAGRLDTIKETTLQFLTRQKAQIAINAHFFSPWPPPRGDKGEANLNGLAASNGHVYSPFAARSASQPAGGDGRPALNIDAHNRAAIVYRNPNDPTGRTAAEPVTLYNAVAGNEQILRGGAITAGAGKALHPRTVIGLSAPNKLVLFIVDGRQSGISEGMTTREMAELLRRDYGVTDAINLDGGGSTTLCLADPRPRVVNGPVGMGLRGSLRSVGSSLAVFAAATQPAATSRPAGRGPTASGPAGNDTAIIALPRADKTAPSAPTRPVPRTQTAPPPQPFPMAFLLGSAAFMLLGLAVLVLWRRRSS